MALLTSARFGIFLYSKCHIIMALLTSARFGIFLYSKCHIIMALLTSARSDVPSLVNKWTYDTSGFILY